MRQVEWLVRWFTAEDWRTWISHFLLVFFGFRAVFCDVRPLVWIYAGVVLVIFGAIFKEVYEYNEDRGSVDSILDALSYVLGALVAAWSIGFFA